ncbi:hypothetical protein [Tenacibaculum aestuarii]|uniref:hypothetical protein n=1 Tax=Tenacibaculum aestuarii TaxID=362781 RepID=UPI0038956DC1
MKKHLLFITLLFILASTNLTQAQTKEETIFWLKEYGFDMLTYTSPISSKFSYEYKIDVNSIWLIKYQANNQGIRSKSSETKINYECLKKPI